MEEEDAATYIRYVVCVYVSMCLCVYVFTCLCDYSSICFCVYELMRLCVIITRLIRKVTSRLLFTLLIRVFLSLFIRSLSKMFTYLFLQLFPLMFMRFTSRVMTPFLWLSRLPRPRIMHNSLMLYPGVATAAVKVGGRLSAMLDGVGNKPHDPGFFGCRVFLLWPVWRSIGSSTPCFIRVICDS